MFSKNNKISSRQIRRLLIFDLFGISSLLLPAQLARAGNGAGIWGLILGGILAGLYLWVLTVCCSQVTQDYMHYLTQGWGSLLARLLYVGYAVVLVLVSAWAAKLLAQLMCDSLLDGREFSTALLLVVLLALYGGVAGLEARARVYEILFWVLAGPVVIMLLLCVRQVQTVQWFPFWQSTGSGGQAALWEGALQCFAAFLPLSFLVFMVPHMQDKKKAGRTAIQALAVSAFALAAIYLILTGIFGSDALTREQYPIVTLMGMVKIPGEFVKRLDAVMVSVWFFTLYALIGAALYYGVAAIQRIFAGEFSLADAGGQGDEKRRPGQKYWFFVMAAVVYGIAYGFREVPPAERLAGRLFYRAGIPFLVLVPIVSILLYRLKNTRRGKQAEAE